MTKALVIFIILIVSCQAPRNDRPNTDGKAFGNENFKTTIDSVKAAVPPGVTILSESTFNGTYQAFYICDFDKFEKVDYLREFDFREHEMNAYNTSIDRIKTNELSRIFDVDNLGLKRNWLPVYRHDNQYYTYAPSDWGNCGKRMITDSTFVIWYMDGPYPLPIHDIARTSERSYELKLNDDGLRESRAMKLNVYELNNPQYVWMFEFDYGNGNKRHELYVPIEDANKLDLLVNHSPFDKAMEYEFDELNIEEILKNNQH